MKEIIKNKTVRIFSLGMVLAGMVSLGIFMQGCSNEVFEETDYMNVYEKHLDLDIASTDAFTKMELNTLAEAAHRIITNMVFDKKSNKYVFGLKSSSEINVSERLFNYIYPGVNMNVTNMPRLKSDNSECVTTSGWGWTSTTCEMNDEQLVNTFQSMIDVAGEGSMGAGILGAVASLVPGGQLMGSGLGLLSLALAAQQGTLGSSYNEYINTSNRSGGTITATSVNVPNAGWVTTYHFSFSKR